MNSKGKTTQEYYQKRYPGHIPLYSHPDGQNLQITPYQGPRRKEYHVQPFLNKEPQTAAQQRQEEISLGKFRKTEQTPQN